MLDGLRDRVEAGVGDVPRAWIVGELRTMREDAALATPEGTKPDA